jgi:CCR4-NOT transcriptional regulation complex NOT5 subunit
MSDFGKAFKSARAAGKKTFKFNGKLYTTKMKDEGKSKSSSTSYAKNPSNVPTPASKGSMELGKQAERSTSSISVAGRPDTKSAAKDTTKVASVTPTKKVALPRVKAAIAAVSAAVNAKGVKAGDTIAKAPNRADAYKASVPKKAATTTDTKPKKKVGPFGLGGMFKLGVKS